MDSKIQTILLNVDKSVANRECEMPDEASAITVLFEAYTRLTELGFKEAIYCPKDGTLFEVIEAGSTGIFKCHYEGKWPDGSYWIHNAGDLLPSNPILYRDIIKSA